jgi:hypothetical protein
MPIMVFLQMVSCIANKPEADLKMGVQQYGEEKQWQQQKKKNLKCI